MRRFMLIVGGMASLYSHDLTLMGESMKMNYSEFGQSGNLLDTEKSSLGQKLGGITLKSHVGEWNGFIAEDGSLEFLLRRHWGTTKYVGDSLTTPQGYGSIHGNSSVAITQTQVTWKETHKVNNTKASSFLGLGFRQWERGLSKLQNETYKWSYGVVGIEVSERVGRMSVGVQGAYRYAFKPKMEWVEEGLTFDLGSVKGWNGQLWGRYEINSRLFLYGQYEYDAWTIGHSSSLMASDAKSYYEPDSQTKNHILGFGAGIKF